MVVALSTWLQLLRGRGVEERGGGSQVSGNSLHGFQGVLSSSSLCSGDGGAGRMGLAQETLPGNFGSEALSETGLAVGDRDVCGLFSLFRDKWRGSLYSPLQGLVTPPTTETKRRQTLSNKGKKAVKFSFTVRVSEVHPALKHSASSKDKTRSALLCYRTFQQD